MIAGHCFVVYRYRNTTPAFRIHLSSPSITDRVPGSLDLRIFEGEIFVLRIMQNFCLSGETRIYL